MQILLFGIRGTRKTIPLEKGEQIFGYTSRQDCSGNFQLGKITMGIFVILLDKKPQMKTHCAQKECEKLKHTPALKCHHMSSPVLRPLQRGIIFTIFPKLQFGKKLQAIFSPSPQRELLRQSGRDGG